MNQRQKDSLKQVWMRVRDVVSKMSERLGNEKSPLFDSLIGNARDLIDILPALNLTNDAELNAIAAELQGILVPVDRMRQDKRLRADVAAKADAILAKLPWA
jgi:flagellar biosynthesis/type III secretory pathway chaperone